MTATTHISDSRGFCTRAIRGTAHGPLAAAFRTALKPLAWPYAALTRLRRRAYAAHIFRTRKLDVPVISVGNITVGGTGKTPMVEWLARRLKDTGRRPAILSRGYRPLNERDPAGDRKNDERLLLEENLPGVLHFAHPDRVRAGREAIAAGADCLVLDDGFQHLRLHRDVNIALIDARDPFGHGTTLPAGPLREPLSALLDADAAVISHADTVPAHQLASLRRRLAELTGHAPLVEAVHRPAALITADHASLPPAYLAGRRALLFCAIAGPEHFLETARRLGASVPAAHFFPDHFHYRPEHLVRLVQSCRRVNAEVALTTQKDAVKIARAWQGAIPLLVLRIEFHITSGRGELERLLQAGLSV